MTDKGIGFTPDSVAYLNTSDNLANGKGFTLSYGNPPNQWNSYYPPLYPAILSISDLIGVSDVKFARWFQLLCLTLFLITISKIFKNLKLSLFIEFFSLLIIAISTPVLIIYSNAWSEGLFLWLGFLSLFLFIQVFTKTNQNKYFFLSGCIFALVNLTRYAGITFLGAAVLFIFLNKPKHWQNKLTKAVYLGLPTVFVYSFWFGMSKLNGANGANRDFGLNQISFEKIRSATGTILEWFYFPEMTPLGIKLVFLAILFSLLAYSIIKLIRTWNSTDKENFTRPTEKLILVFLAIYPLFILFSLTFLDANIPLDTRILSPFFISLMLVLISLIPRKIQSVPNFIVKAIMVGFVTIQVAFLIPFSYQNHTIGIGFNHRFWRETDIWDEITQLKKQSVILSNAPEPLYFYTRIDSITLPKKYFVTSQTTNTLYDEEIFSLKNGTLKTGDILVYFPKIKSAALPTETELLSEFPWELLFKTEQANIYVYR